MHAIFIFQNIQLLFLEMLLILIGENISAFISFSISARYQVIHRYYLNSRYSLDMQASRQYPLAEILGPDHYQLDRLVGSSLQTTYIFSISGRQIPSRLCSDWIPDQLYFQFFISPDAGFKLYRMHKIFQKENIWESINDLLKYYFCPLTLTVFKCFSLGPSVLICPVFRIVEVEPPLSYRGN